MCAFTEYMHTYDYTLKSQVTHKEEAMITNNNKNSTETA